LYCSDSFTESKEERPVYNIALSVYCEHEKFKKNKEKKNDLSFSFFSALNAALYNYKATSKMKIQRKPNKFM